MRLLLTPCRIGVQAVYAYIMRILLTPYRIGVQAIYVYHAATSHAIPYRCAGSICIYHAPAAMQYLQFIFFLLDSMNSCIIPNFIYYVTDHVT